MLFHQAYGIWSSSQQGITTVDLSLDGSLERYQQTANFLPFIRQLIERLLALVPYTSLFTNGKRNQRRATNLHITPGHTMTNPLGGFVDLRESNSTPIGNKDGGEINDFNH